MDLKTVLLAIDLQFDFCNPQGSLYVDGADGDMRDISKFIDDNLCRIDNVILSMDSHQPIHIAHQIYWIDKEGNHPTIFSSITRDAVERGEWIPQYNREQALDYLMKLEANNDVCTIWPPHCIIGTKGWSIDETVFKSIENWTIHTGKSYKLINKGMHQSSEHYSIFKAAVEYSNIKDTLFNLPLLDELRTYDRIIIVGEAADFCVANSLNDLLVHAPDLAKSIYILTDCMSDIIPNNPRAKLIYDNAARLGVQFCKSSTLTNY